jgi:hypothetical protein
VCIYSFSMGRVYFYGCPWTSVFNPSASSSSIDVPNRCSIPTKSGKRGSVHNGLGGYHPQPMALTLHIGPRCGSLLWFNHPHSYCPLAFGRNSLLLSTCLFCTCEIQSRMCRDHPPSNSVLYHSLAFSFILSHFASFTPAPHNATGYQYRRSTFLDAPIWDEQVEHGYHMQTFTEGFRAAIPLPSQSTLLCFLCIVSVFDASFHIPTSFGSRFYFLFVIFPNVLQFRRPAAFSSLLEILSISHMRWASCGIGC